MSYPSNSAIYGGVRLRPTASIESRCSREGIEVPIEDVIPAGIVKRLKEEREGANTTTRESTDSGADSENGKVANLIKLTQQRTQLAKSPPHKEIPAFLHCTSSVSSVDGDKYGITLQSYESASVVTSNPRTDEIIKASRNYVSNLPNGSIVSVRSIHGSGNDKYGITMRSSVSVSSNPSLGNWTKSKTSPRDTIRASRSNVSNATKGSAESARDGPPPLIFDSSIIDYADESILETELCKKILNAFEATLKNNPGLLPGGPQVIESLNSTLAKLMKDNDDREDQMRNQIENVKAENEEIERKLSDLRGSLTLKNIELTKELEKEQQEKERTEDALKKLTDANKAMKQDVKCKMDETTKEKEELTKHIGILTKSRDEIKSSLETEMKLVEKDREALRIVVDGRKPIQKQKAENKELESQIEIMTEAASKKKAALQAEAAEIKTFEDRLQQLKQSNDAIRKEVEDEKRELLEITLTLQSKKQAVIESKAELEIRMEKEKEALENQVENSRMMNAKDMERLVNSKIDRYFKRRGISETEKDGICFDGVGAVTDIESIIKSRVAVELKQKEIEMKERELERKEEMMKEKEMKERDIRKRELDEQLLKESEILEKITRKMKMRERELEERIMRERKEKGLRLNHIREKRTNMSDLVKVDKNGTVGVEAVGKQNGMVGMGDSCLDMNAALKSRVVPPKQKEIERETRQSNSGVTRKTLSNQSTDGSLKWAASSTTTEERCNKSFHGERPFPNVYVSNDDEKTVGDDSTVALNELSVKNLRQMAGGEQVGSKSEGLKQSKPNEKDSKLTDMQKELLKLREELSNVRLKKERFEQILNEKNEFSSQCMDEDSLKHITHQEFTSLGHDFEVKGSSFDFQRDNVQLSSIRKVASHDKHDDKGDLSRTLPRSASSSPLDSLQDSSLKKDHDDANKAQTHAYRSCLLPRLAGLHKG
ncbi:hypothetical protein HJC23_007262 [Cyclotella cryptica]|uniref:Uncharacterized protein n=1 Tax=Cyclotella cryptica TaxID=29204 RepID=A0ABD3Q0L4_9STRA|eukprot:CCRYP_010045-RA/>CCRYP_010045-RA protein AED:0.34 eAED:0.34 QI:0/-1/0/1/-1/1/1/0/944